jgi:phospholipid-binding lipoprotein MlaA
MKLKTAKVKWMRRDASGHFKFKINREGDVKSARLGAIWICALCFLAFFSHPAGAGEMLTDPALEGDVSPTENDVEAFDQFEEFDEKSAAPEFDPLEKYNRWMTRFNDRLYFWVLKPTAQGYNKILNEPVRIAVSRFFKNLYFPVRGVNNLLQMKFKHAGIETARFGINSTLGFFGFFDPAKICWDLDAYPEDFGQTLGYYGSGSGFHIVLPFLGPSNLRDAFGKVPDLFLNPVYYCDDEPLAIGVSAYEKINTVSLNMETYETLRKDAVDLYLFFRNAYEENRNSQIGE